MISSYEDAVTHAEEALRETRRTGVPDSLKVFTDRCAAGEVPPVSATNLTFVLRLAWLLYQMGLHTASHSLVRRLVSDPPQGYPPGGDPNRCAVLLTCLGHPDEAQSLLTRLHRTDTADKAGAGTGSEARPAPADAPRPAGKATGSGRADWESVRAMANLAAISAGTQQPRQAAHWLAQADLLLAAATEAAPVEIRRLLAGVRVFLARRTPSGPSRTAAATEFTRASLDAIAALDPRDPQGYLIVAQLALAAVEDARDAQADDRLEHAAGILEAASQRLSAMLGADHPRALVVQGKLAAVHVECARAARSPLRLRKATTDLAFIGSRLNRHVGARHPQALAAAGNLAVARLECARACHDRAQADDILQDLYLQWRSMAALLGDHHPVVQLVQASYQVCRTLTEKITASRADYSSAPAAGYPASTGTAHLAGPSPTTRSATATSARAALNASSAATQLQPAPTLQPQVAVNDIGNEEAFLAAIDETIKYFNDGDIV
ncbi:hypothetical protein, partial [Streptomyces sp. NPDC004065]|uniref:hypothetical protein n=1 Tax=Streptomyces sp. NPDC004065 TaxID=3364689 RepID=UPI00384CAC7B